MKKLTPLFLFTLIAIFFSSCSVVTGIFKAGMGFGIFIVVAIIILIVWLVMRGRSK